MGSLAVHVRDDGGNPIAGKRVRCEFLNILSPIGGGTRSEEFTDEDGTAKFDEVPVCTVAVHVDGGETRVGVGAGEHEDVTISL